MTTPLDGFSVSAMTFNGETRDVYRRGSGPGVVVMHEAPGITPQVARFATTLADAGFTVFMPALFGTPGRAMTVPYTLHTFASVCIRREIHLFAGDHSSPVLDWLRALTAAVHAELGGPGVGAIGMCMTGNFALALMVEPAMIAPVLSQPSLPVALTRRGRAALHVSDEELAVARRRAREEGVPVLAMRFTHDILCPKERFVRLRDELGDKVEAIEIDSSPGNPHGIPRTAHSVVTIDLVDREGHPTKAALDRVLSFFTERLGPVA